MRLSISQIARYTGANVLTKPASDPALVQGLSWDSRTVKQQELFVALPGDRVDGHAYIASAIDAGASCVLIEQRPSQEILDLSLRRRVGLLQVESTMQAICDLAKSWRAHLSARVIALTGSTGKTTTKNLARAVLSSAFKVSATKANQNNELGVPNTVLSAEEDTRFLIVEMGMRGFGQISQLCEIARPHWGLITNVQDSHKELLGSRENVARAKAELYCALSSTEGIAFVNAADDLADYMLECGGLDRFAIPSVYFGIPAAVNTHVRACYEMHPALWAEDIRVDGWGRPEFSLCVRGFQNGSGAFYPADTVQRRRCQLALCGVHNVSNALAAAALGLQAGISLENVVAALHNARAEAGRMQIIESARQFSVINDSYNASPASTAAALSALAAIPAQGRRIAVLGDMLELGEDEQKQHADMGAFAAEEGIDILVCVGSLSELSARAAREAGMGASAVLEFEDTRSAAQALDLLLHAGDVVLLKASHAMGFDYLAEVLI